MVFELPDPLAVQGYVQAVAGLSKTDTDESVDASIDFMHSTALF